MHPAIHKLAALPTYLALSVSDRRRLERLSETSPVARAFLAVKNDTFAPDERATFDAIESRRSELMGRPDPIGRDARISSISPRGGRLLYALAREVRPDSCIELGTAFGVSGLYVLAGLHEAGGGKLITIEGAADRSEIAVEGFEGHGRTAFQAVVGDFDTELPSLLAAIGPVALAFIDGNHQRAPTERYDSLVRAHATHDAVIVHDDIRWTRDMASAWRVLAARPGQPFDAFRIGVIETAGTGDVVRVRL